MNQDIICAAPVREEQLSAAVAEFFRTLRPRRERLQAYYAGEQSVPKGEAVRGRPDNRLRVPFPRYITEVHTGYFLGQMPTLAFEKREEAAAFKAVSAAVELPRVLFEAARDMSVCGAGYLLVWLERSGLRVCRCDPAACFSLRSDTADQTLLGCVRFYRDARDATRGVLYQRDAQRPFLWEAGGVRFGAPEENLLRAPALIPFSNNAEGSGDFEPVCSLVDAYNLLVSGAMDDMQSVANAFLALYGMQGTTKADVDEANRTRILSLAEGGKAEFVVKNLNHEALGQLEQNLRRNILQLSMTPDLSDESFSGTASGVALQYKLWGIEQVRSAKERSFSEGLHALLDALSGGLSTLGTPVTFAAAPTFYKNLPQNNGELCETLLSLKEVLSRRTILENLPWVADPEEEWRRKKEEKE